MAGKMKGTKLRDFQKSTTARTMTSILLIPRLPTPIATVEPGASRAPKFALVSSRVISPGMSASRRSGKFWRTRSMRGSATGMNYINAEALSTPLFREQLRVFVRGENLEVKQAGVQQLERLH